MLDLFTSKHIYGRIFHEGKEYNLIFDHPYKMLRDKNISWEAKGYLSHICTIEDEIELSLYVIAELIQFGYLVEVKQ